jgi:thiol-disulfide isomerase/thioredoxin
MNKLFKVIKIVGIILFAIILSGLLFIGIYSQIGNSKIEAQIDGLGTKLFAYNYKSIEGGERHIKFGYCINDRVRIKASTKDKSKLMIRILEKRTTCHSKDITLFIEPEKETKIKGKLNEISIDYEMIEGSNMCRQYVELRKELLPLLEEESRLWFKWWQIRDTKSEKSKQLGKQFHNFKFNIVAPARFEWAKQHLDYELSPKYFLESDIPKDSVIRYHRLLASNAKKSIYGEMLSARIAGWEKTKNGDMAPDFLQTTIDGNSFKLTQMRGKYLVLDFWGTWCGACMYGVPKMREYYKKYKTQVEFIGIACNDKESDWKKAIEDNQMNWIQILNDKSLQDIAKLYGIGSFPTKIIINQNGEIINKFIGEGEDFYHAVDSIMKEKLPATLAK